MQTDVLLVRHPETEANVEGRFVGRSPSPFSAEGKRQLRRLPAKIAAFDPDEIWTSPLERAARLASVAGRAAGLEPRVDNRLVEIAFGAVEGMTFAEIEAAGMAFDYRNLDAPVAPGGESRRQVEDRAREFAEQLIARPGRFAVITHGGVFRAALAYLLGLDPDDIWAFHIRNASMAHVRITDGHGMLEYFVQG